MEEEDLKLIGESGFKDIQILNRLDYFSESPSENTKLLTKMFDAETRVITATN